MTISLDHRTKLNSIGWSSGVVRYLAEAVPIRKAVTGIASLSGTEKDVVSRGGEQGLDLFLSLLARGGAAVLKQKDVDAVALTRSATAFCPTLESRPPTRLSGSSS
jgi:hypothetical protein